ncbi:HAD family hydrolase [Clostridiaceae bacterium M8S5]|nr:HAD family hydrolase [Clostridiaceae bacterium M8S5]
MNTKDIQVFFFDMGNTLMDFHQGKTDVEKDIIGLQEMQKYLDKFGINYTVDELKVKFLDPLDEYMINSRKKNGHETPIEDFFRLIVDKKLLSEKVILELSKLFYSQYMKEVVVNDFVVDILKYVKQNGKKIGIISNCFLPEEVYIDIFKSKGIDKYVDRYFFSYSNNYMKPNIKLFNKALEYFKVIGKEAIMIGDNFKADILPAHELGMKTCLCNKKDEMNPYGLKVIKLRELYEKIT